MEMAKNSSGAFACPYITYLGRVLPYAIMGMLVFA